MSSIRSFPTFAEWKGAASGLLKSRALGWRWKAMNDIKAHPDSCILRAQECEECARLIENLKENDL